MRIVFAGTPEFAAVSLARLLALRFEVVAAYTRPDRPAGRGRKPRPSPVKVLALGHGLVVEQPGTLRTGAAAEHLASYRPDLLVVAAYGLILPQAMLDVPRLGCVNVHASLLPRWRGAAPVQRAIMAGDTHSGVTLMQMDAGLDSGGILCARTCLIAPDDTGGRLLERLAELGADLLVEALPRLAAGSLAAVPQPDEGVTYAPRLSVEDAVLDWERPAEDLERLVRAVDPWPVARSALHGRALRVWRARVGATPASIVPAHPGQVLAADREGIAVATGDGTLVLERVQRPGGKPIAVRDFLNGTRVEPGDLFASARSLARQHAPRPA